MINLNHKFKTDVFTLQKLGATRFLIPTYQRPYVWRDEQVHRLLDDFWSAYEREDPHYFIGAILTSAIDDQEEELIDGQQRFITLWLTAIAFKLLKAEADENQAINTDLTCFLEIDDKLRLNFAIRKKLNDYLSLLLKDETIASRKYPQEEIEKNDYLIHVANAVSTIKGKIDSLDTNQKGSFGDYIFEKVQFVKNTAPSNMNLNKLFATMNSTGIQLEQSDILKSKLLKNLKTEKELYSRIWEACENMEYYFEKNVLKLFPRTDRCEVIPTDFSDYKDEIFKYNNEGSESNQDDNSVEGFLLSDLINVPEGNSAGDNEQKEICNHADSSHEDDWVHCKSIINFPQLLLHTYRIHLANSGKEDFDKPFHQNNLLQTFEPLYRIREDSETSDQLEEEIKEFFKNLWKIRYIFDRHVVKKIDSGDDKKEVLTLQKVAHYDKKGKRYFSRKKPESMDSITMLQSVLYFTGNYNTQIWLSPYLKKLMEGETSLECLESIDNDLSLSKAEDKPTTYNLMKKIYKVSDDQKMNLEQYLNEPKGTGFKHYWFQKLEYILWKELDKKNDWKVEDEKKFKRYRITSKNSIEHIFPQNEEHGKSLPEKTLHSFGNLTLLNVSQNSSYSNQEVEKKRVDFEHKPVYDSLKLCDVFTNYDDKWEEPEIDAHGKKMIRKILDHYGIT